MGRLTFEHADIHVDFILSISFSQSVSSYVFFTIACPSKLVSQSNKIMLISNSVCHAPNLSLGETIKHVDFPDKLRVQKQIGVLKLGVTGPLIFTISPKSASLKMFCEYRP